MQSLSHTVALSDAKANLSQLIERVEHGETVLITRHGLPVAWLVPCIDTVERDRSHAAVDQLLAFRGPRLPRGSTIASLIRRGRR